MGDFVLTGEDMIRRAGISPCKRYRYWLTRDWGSPTQLGVTFVLLNPSTADAEKDDPTVRKCIGFARRWGFGGMAIVNLFGWRATNPRDLIWRRDEGISIVGPENAEAIKRYAGAARRIVFGWGSALPKELRGHVPNVVELVSAATTMRPRCLGCTQDGQPRHPLMPAYDTPLEIYDRG